MEKYTKVSKNENVKNVNQDSKTKQPQNYFDHNTPHSWSNMVGFGNIKISTSDNKHYLSKWNHSS